MNNINVGDRVKCYVEVGRELVEMHTGIVTELQDGYYIVDRMSLHGGAPWLCKERFVSKIERSPNGHQKL
jgi:hypothetical protein